MRRLFAFTAALVVLAAAGLAADENGTTYGNGVKLTTSVKVADLLAAPDRYVGKNVRVDGTVRAVCQNMGCWIEIADDPRNDAIQFKVDDGVIVFPKDAQGKRASAEGTFERIAADDAHEAERAAQAAAASKETAAPKPPAYRIRATGAIIY